MKHKTFLPHNIHGNMIKINDGSFAVFAERKVIKIKGENAIFIRKPKEEEKNKQLQQTKANSLGNFANLVCLHISVRKFRIESC